MARRRLLIATYYFPPDPSVGSRRWDAMSAWLRALGHQVTILTTPAWGATSEDQPWVMRSSDLVTSRALRRMLRRPDLPAAGRQMPIQKPPSRLLADVVVPDAHLLHWVLGAVPVARRLIAERRIECLVTTGPPQSTHLLGLFLGDHRPAWLTDFRDGWRYEMLRDPWPMQLQDRLDAALERRVVKAADGAVAVTEPIARDFATRLGARATCIPNGWDPRAERLLSNATRPLLDARCVNIVHTGQLSGLRGRNPRPLFEALDLLRRQHPDAAARVRIVLAGRLDIHEQQLLRGLADSGGISHVGYLDRMAAAALQRDADALLLLTSVGHKSQVTGKLFEYLAAGRPIIALAEGNEAARVVTETRTGMTVAPDNVEAIADALLAAVDGRLSAAYTPKGLERYVYPAPAEAFAAEVEKVLGCRRASRS